MRNALNLAADLHEVAQDEPPGSHWWLYRAVDTSVAEVALIASASYLNLARHKPELARDAEVHTLASLANRPAGTAKQDVLEQVRLAQVRFVAGEPEQACADADRALAMAAKIRGSQIVKMRLGELAADSAPLPGRGGGTRTARAAAAGAGLMITAAR